MAAKATREIQLRLISIHRIDIDLPVNGKYLCYLDAQEDCHSNIAG
jgi:hypothetical protein